MCGGRLPVSEGRTLDIRNKTYFVWESLERETEGSELGVGECFLRRERMPDLLEVLRGRSGSGAGPK